MESNVQKMRETLEAWLKACDDFIAKPRSGKWPKNPCGTVVIPLINAAYLFEMTKSALALPLRNCDVGTAEEQFKRYDAFCRCQSRGCRNCPANVTRIRGTSNCDLAWAQMPYEAYEEGGAK